MNKICPKCRTEKEDSCFSWNNASHTVRKGICKPCANSITRAWHKTPQGREYHRQWHAAHKEQRNAKQRTPEAKEYHRNFSHAWSAELKLAAFNKYGKACLCCNETHNEMLNIDHIHGRKSVGHARNMKGPKLYKWLADNNYPSGFQTLCFNCNFSKHRFGECSHKHGAGEVA